MLFKSRRNGSGGKNYRVIGLKLLRTRISDGLDGDAQG